jgi:hypothetical protein
MAVVRVPCSAMVDSHRQITASILVTLTKTQEGKPIPVEKKPTIQLEPINKLSKPTQVEPESSQQVAH